MNKLIEANARLQLSKAKDPSKRKQQDDLQRALEGAEGYLLDEVEGDGDATHRVAVVREAWWRRSYARCSQCLQRFANKMGRSDLRYIEARFGEGIVVYFQFQRWLWFLNVLALLLTMLIVGWQWVQMLSANDAVVWMPASKEAPTLVVPFVSHVPHFVLFSFVSKSGLGPYIYSATLLTLAAFLVGMAVHKYSTEKGKEKADSVYAAADANKFSRLAFSGWDFNLMDQSAVEDAKIQAAEDLEMSLKESEMLAARANRTKAERNRLLRRRAIGISLNTLMIGGSWAAIFLVTIWSSDKANIESMPFLEKVANVMPLTNIVLSLINAILPFLTSRIVKFEQYDVLATAFKMETTRLYLGKILNVLVLMYTGANSFVGGGTLRLPGLSSRWQPDGQCSYGLHEPTSSCPDNALCWQCPEDELGWVLFKTLILDFFAGKVVAVGIGEAKRARGRKKNDMTKAKSDFQTSSEVIELLYVQAVAWLAIPYLPVVSIWQPIVLYINFKWDKWVLLRYKRKPVRTFAARKA